MAFGAIDLIFLLFNLLEYNSFNTIEFNQEMINRAFGKYWIPFWIYPFTYFALTQLLWVEKIKASKIIRVLIAVWIFAVMHIEHYIILVTTLHRDYNY
jgi:hypothetical protein